MKTLKDIFYEAWQDGWIFSRDDEGCDADMSYGDYAAVDDYMRDCVNEQLVDMNFEQAVDGWREIVTDGADDDSLMFCCYTDDEVDPFCGAAYLHEDEAADGTWIWRCDDPERLPEILREKWREYEDETAWHDEIAA